MGCSARSLKIDRCHPKSYQQRCRLPGCHFFASNSLVAEKLTDFGQSFFLCGRLSLFSPLFVCTQLGSKRCQVSLTAFRLLFVPSKLPARFAIHIVYIIYTLLQDMWAECEMPVTDCCAWSHDCPVIGISVDAHIQPEAFQLSVDTGRWSDCSLKLFGISLFRGNYPKCPASGHRVIK